MLTLNDGRNELWQWDTNRKITVDAECSQVHFSNKVFGRSIDVDVVDGVAIIPDVLLQSDKDLTAWAFVGIAENGYTRISKVFKVNKRNKPSDYVFTQPEQTTLEEIKEKIEHLESIHYPDAIKNAVEDYLEQNPVEAPVQSVNGKTGKVFLTATDVGAISQDDLQEATNEALAQAKASGEFDGKDGVDGKDGSNGVSVEHSWDGTVLNIKSASGESSADLKGDKGDAGFYPVVTMDTNTAEIQPNVYYRFGEVATLTITLAAAADDAYTNEYIFEFISGATATTLTLPDTIKWVAEPSIEASKTYQVSIMNGIGVIGGA